MAKASTRATGRRRHRGRTSPPARRFARPKPQAKVAARGPSRKAVGTGPRLTVLVTGFGPFPGAPRNPSGPLAQHLARLRRPAFTDVRLHAHVFATSYAAVDRELPQLLKRLQPEAILMFGLAARTPHLRIETRARNAVAGLPDAARFAPSAGRIVKHAAALAARLPLAALIRAARSQGLPAQRSFDAGRYVCNYLFWRGLEAAMRPGGPRLVTFVHVPKLRPPDRRRPAATSAPRGDQLARTGEAVLRAVIAAARRPSLPGTSGAAVRHRRQAGSGAATCRSRRPPE